MRTYMCAASYLDKILQKGKSEYAFSRYKDTIDAIEIISCAQITSCQFLLERSLD